MLISGLISPCERDLRGKSGGIQKQDPCPPCSMVPASARPQTFRAQRPLTNLRRFPSFVLIIFRAHLKSHLQSFVVCLVQITLRPLAPNPQVALRRLHNESTITTPGQRLSGL